MKLITSRKMPLFSVLYNAYEMAEQAPTVEEYREFISIFLETSMHTILRTDFFWFLLVVDHNIIKSNDE